MDHSDSRPQSASEAIHAVSRLLTTAVEAQGPAAVQQALVREARTSLRTAAALLLELDEGAETAQIIAGDPEPTRRTVRLDDVPPVRELRARRRGPIREGGRAAAPLLQAVGAPAGAGVLLFLPMRSRDELSHVLVLADTGRRTFGGEEVEVAAAFANAATASLAQLRLAHEHAEQVAQHAALARAARILNESLDLAQVLGRICEEAAFITDGDTASVYLGDGDGLVVEAIHNLPPEVVGYRLAKGAGLSGKAFELDRPMLTNDYQRIAKPAPDSPFARIRGSLAVPMHWDGELRGVLSVGYLRPVRLTGDHLRRLETFAELAAVACRNASLHQGLAHAARTDGLTGCLNHAALQEHLRREIDRCERTGHPLSFVLIDLDHFKQVNEAHGHLVGDEVLRRVGHALSTSTRPYDVIARYGGDEFGLVAVDAHEAEACEIAERAIERLTAAVGDLAGNRRFATAGVAEWRPGLTPTDLIAAADQALLRGKAENTRGRALRADPRDVRFAGAERLPMQLALNPPPGPPAHHAVAQLPPGADGGVTREQTERLRKRTRQLALANALGTRLAGMTDPESILDAAIDELHRAFDYHLCAVIRIRDDGYVESAAGRGEAFVRLGEQRWSQPRSAGIIGRCLRERRPVIVNDVTRDPTYKKTSETGDTLSELTVPLWVGDELWGAINVEEVERDAFDEDDARLVQTVADQVGSALRSAFLYERLERAMLGTAEALAAALEAKDHYTAQHARSIVENAEAVGRRLGMGEQELRDLRYGAAFHDIGKLSVPEAILNKRGPLTPEERAVMERHTIVGEQILAPVEFLAGVLPLVRHEHERWDGTGYPDGLAGEAIPLGARIILACDAYHAMTSDRPYRAAMSEAEARAELRRNAGTQFDPAVVEALLAVLGPVPDDMPEIAGTQLEPAAG